ncbi:hypothetical protein MNBD_GAMMA26-1129 [hydrothermal vent metagenome]|uniref:GIY-YIG domain-containing protein n=1 Tax=hydrothermal vent metagenome TaxID=652676 RepID=A0A3B1BGR0_9ZZZZ
MDWRVYIILCTNGSLYTGISNDVARRLTQHLNKRGAKFFRGHTPKQLVYLEKGHSRSSASCREAAIKQLSRAEKLCLIESEENAIKGLEINISDGLEHID